MKINNDTDNLSKYEILIKKEILSQEDCLKFNDIVKSLVVENRLFFTKDGFEVLLKVVKSLDIENDLYKPSLKNNDLIMFRNLIDVLNLLIYGREKIRNEMYAVKFYEEYKKEIVKSFSILYEKILNGKRKYNTEENINNYIDANMKIFMAKKEAYANVTMFMFLENQLSKDKQINLICNKIFEYKEENFVNKNSNLYAYVLRIPRRVFYYNVPYVMPEEYELSKNIFIDRIRKFLMGSNKEMVFSVDKVGDRADFDIEIKFESVKDEKNLRYKEEIGEIIENNFRALINRFEHSPIIEEKILKEIREASLKYYLNKQNSEIEKVERNKVKI